MNAKEFYESVGGDYPDVLSRFVNEERVLRFVRKFPADGTFTALKEALNIGSQEEAFRAAHTLKGVAQNLGFKTMYEKAVAVTEILRGGSMEVASDMPALEEIYKRTVKNIGLLD